MATKYDCVACRKQVTATRNNRYRSHKGIDGDPCEMGSAEIPEHVLANPVGADDAPDVPREDIDFTVCPHCRRKVKLTRLGYFEPHDMTLRGRERCPNGGVRFQPLKRLEDVPLPGDELPEKGVYVQQMPKVSDTVIGNELVKRPESALSAGSGVSTETSSPESATTSGLLREWTEASDSFFLETVHAMLMDAAGWPEESVAAVSDQSDRPQDPGFDGMLFEKRPSRYPPRAKGPEIPMTGRALELAARLRETFYAYTNRNSSDNRSAQTTIGPSEAGTPCDRQLAMKLLGIEPVNPQEGWAPFVGTAVHAELARMFEWANGGGSGRYVTEMSVSLGDPHVPRGTLDLLDRVLYMVNDHKLMGRWSLDKLRKEGPSETYRKQIQIYGLGAELAGEEVREVAIIGWPRQESKLDKLYVYVEPYDRKIAQEALDRVARIAAEVKQRTGPGTPREPMGVAKSFPVEDDCLWCSFHLKGDKEMTRGCPGK